MNIYILGQLVYIVPALKLQEFRKPLPLAVTTHQAISSLQCRLAQVEGLSQHGYIFRLDLVVADLHLEIGTDAPAPGAFGVQGEHRHLGGKELLQPLHLMPTFAGSLPAILVVHVENQVYRRPLLYHSYQQKPGEEGLAGAALAEDPVASLDILVEVETHLGLHVQRVPDVEMLFVLAAEHQAHVLVRRLPNLREVGRDGPYRLGPLTEVLVPCAYRQHGRDLEAPEQGGTRQHLGDERIRYVGRTHRQARVDALQLDIGYHPKEPLFIPLDDHVSAHRHLLDGGLTVELHPDPFVHGTSHHHAQRFFYFGEELFSHGLNPLKTAFSR